MLIAQFRAAQELQAKKAMGTEVPDAALAAAKKLPIDTRGKYAAFAKYTSERWATEDVGQLARYQLSMIRLQENELPAAFELLQGVTPDSRLKPMAQFQSAMILYQLEQKDNDPTQRVKAVTMLASIPEPTDPADTPIVENFVKAKLRLASELYGQKKYQDLGKLFERIDTNAKKLPPENLQAGGIKDRLETMRLYTAFGLANEAMLAKKTSRCCKSDGSTRCRRRQKRNHEEGSTSRSGYSQDSTKSRHSGNRYQTGSSCNRCHSSAWWRPHTRCA
jgi:hypothetical protein